MSDRTPDEVVLITGAAGLVGRALVDAFVRTGATVVATDIAPRRERGPAGSDRVVWVTADIGTSAGRREVLEVATGAGRLLVVVHNAAVTTLQGRFLDTTDDDFEHLWRVNVEAVVSMTRSTLGHWRSHGIPGVHLMLCSPGGERAHANQGLYDVTKAALAALVRVVAVEAGPDGVRACGISPASVAGEETVPEPGLPLRRTVSSREVADAAVWLASAQASAITGVVVPVDGGLLSQLRTP